MLARRWRRYSLVAFAVLSTLIAVWGIDVYLVQVAPHWSQRDTITGLQAEALPERRCHADDPTVQPCVIDPDALSDRNGRPVRKSARRANK